VAMCGAHACHDSLIDLCPLVGGVGFLQGAADALSSAGRSLSDSESPLDQLLKSSLKVRDYDLTSAHFFRCIPHPAAQLDNCIPQRLACNECVYTTIDTQLDDRTLQYASVYSLCFNFLVNLSCS
jgi:hypothetical protein